MFYKVRVREVAVQFVIVEADNAEEAENLASEDSNWEEIMYVEPPDITVEGIEEYESK